MKQPRLEGARILDLAHDLVEEAGGAGRRDFDEKGAGTIDRTADHGVTLAAIDRNRLAGDEGLVYDGPASNDLPIDGHALAGTDSDEIANNNRIHRDVAFLTVTDEARCVRLKVEKALHGLRASRLYNQ